MAYYDALKAEWPSVPGADVPTKLATINAMTVNGPKVSVARDVLVQAVNAMTTSYDVGGGATQEIPTWEAIEQSASKAFPEGIAARAAIRLRDFPTYPATNVENPQFQAQMAALEAENLLTSDQAASLVAMATTSVLWWQVNGYLAPINMNDLIAAGLVTP